MKFITAQEAAKKWEITLCRVQMLCSEDRIEGTWRLGNAWAISPDAPKLEDGRVMQLSEKEVDDAFN